MAIDGFDFTVIANGRIDPDSPLSTDLFTDMRDNMEFLKLWQGKDFVGGAVANHNHDGVNSKQLEAADVLNSLSAFVWIDTATAAFTDGPGGASGVVSISSFVPVGTVNVQMQTEIKVNAGNDNVAFRVPGSGTYRVVSKEPSFNNFPIVPVNSSREIDRSTGVDSTGSITGIVRAYQK